MLTIAQAIGSGSIAYWVICAIVIAAVIAIGIVVTRQMGISIPPWIVSIFWIIVAAAVGIVAIRFLLQLAGLL